MVSSPFHYISQLMTYGGQYIFVNMFTGKASSVNVCQDQIKP